ncbi:MAG TPA: type II secretion system protein [Candidatus Paceibacterota bacterium]
MFAKPYSKTRAFTLIEVLTVIAIIGILSAVVLVSMSGSQKKGRDGRRVSDINQIRLALSLYYDAHNNYPPGSTASTAFDTILASVQSEGFIATLPNDPTSGNSYGYIATPSGCSGTSCYGYVLGANLESTNAVLSSSYGQSVAITINENPENCLNSNDADGQTYTISGITYYIYCATN